MAHDHDHAHEHEHEHEPVKAPHEDSAPPEFSPGEAKQARRLTLVLVLVSIFFVAEFIGARAARSDVLQADALHLLMDVLALGMSLFAMRLAVRRPTARFTYGLRRAEPLAAVFNAILIFAAAIEIVREAVSHLEHAETPRGTLMLAVASAALVVNGISAWLLHGAIHHGHDHGHDHGHHEHAHAHTKDPPAEKHEHAKPKKKARGHELNLRGAWLHLLGDTLGSVAALVAAIVIRAGGPAAVDPLASLLVVLILVIGAVRLLRDALSVLVEAAPKHLPVEKVLAVLRGFPGVSEVHDLHVWSLGAGHDAITAHVRCANPQPDLGKKIAEKLRHDFEAEYVTIQVEAAQSEDACDAPPSRFTSS